MEPASPTARGRIKAAALGTVAALALVLLCSMNLTSQGLYYDEVHQAPATFSWLGKKPAMFNPMPIRGVPTLNMSYSGAIKSHLYGFYLKCVSPHFTVRSWRMLGIGLAAAGLVVFGLIAGPAMPTGALVLFLLMIVTDTTVILTSRHDWGPTALALLLRLAFIAVWIGRETGSGGIARRNAILGAIVGIAIFEKLSSAALLPALLIVSLVSVRSMRRRDRLASLLGLALGLLPLLIVNVWSLKEESRLISLANVPGHHSSVSGGDAARYAFRWLSLGQGRVVSHWILGRASSGRLPAIFEALLVLAALAVIVVLWRRRRENIYLRMAATMAACYAAVAVSVFLLPRTTGAHHWILGTPFQYAAVALLAGGLTSPSTAAPTRRPAWIGVAVIAALVLAVRLPAVTATERAIGNGKASADYDPSFTRLGEFAAQCDKRTLFVAADWGLATQIYCLSDGRPGLVFEPFWKAEPDIAVLNVLQNIRFKTCYLVTRSRRTPVFPRKTPLVISAVEQASGWKETAPETETENWASVRVRKLVRDPADDTTPWEFIQ